MARLGKTMGMRSPYDELGVESKATTEDIQTAYRFLAQKFHPDVNPGREDEAKRRFVRVQTAFDVLSDPEQRARYDLQQNAPPTPKIQIIQLPDLEPEPFEPFEIRRQFRPKKKLSLGIAAWFFTACIFAAAIIAYLAWQRIHG
jgi:curved DNA-binding protein CbpA